MIKENLFMLLLYVAILLSNKQNVISFNIKNTLKTLSFKISKNRINTNNDNNNNINSNNKNNDNKYKYMYMTLKVSDLKKLSVKEAINAVSCQAKYPIDKKYLFPNTDIAKQPPTVCTYLIANPKAFFERPKMAKAYGIDVEKIDADMPLEDLGR